MGALLDSNSSYQKVEIVRVDWDEFRDAPVTKELGVRRRSTLIMFNEGKEVGRVVAQTSKAAIQALFKAVV